jgi:hypothetical protein
MKSLLSLVAMAGLVLGLSSCKTPTQVDSSYSTYKFGVECMGTDMDGSQTLRAWGSGKNKSQAMETAKKNAVKAVIFDGVNQGTDGCNQRPIVAEVNAQEKYENYFNRFFADGGMYKEFTSMTDEKRNSRIKSSDSSIENWGIVVRVDRAALRQQLINDGILKP